MSEEQPRAGMYPEWPAICDPTKKFYDPFEEYSAYDGQRRAEKKPLPTHLDKVIDSYSYFRTNSAVETYDDNDGKWKPYLVSAPLRKQEEQITEEQKPEPPRDDYGPYRICP